MKPDRHAEGSNLSKNINRKKGKTDKGKDFAILNAKLIQILRFTSTSNIFIAKKMKFTNTKFTLSATDLANHLSCKHLTQLNRALAKGKIAPPAWHDPDRDRLRELGMAHENAFVGHSQK